MQNSFEVPVLLVVFNRPEVTHRLFEEIRKLKPAKLFISCDGPRKNVVEDRKKVKEVRDIFNGIDWDCEKKFFFREENAGNAIAESEAVRWFFGQVEEGIVLEDDCLPHPSFFGYCKEMLERYRDDNRIMGINGSNFQMGNKRGDASYYFSKIFVCWGWASWKRVWKYYDLNISSLPKFKSQNQIKNIFPDLRMQKYWLYIMENIYVGKVSVWDYPFVYAVLSNGGLAICPNVNLISNIGFGRDGTFCLDEKDISSKMQTHDIGKIVHPDFVLNNFEADKFYMEKYLLSPFYKKCKDKFRLIYKDIRSKFYL